MSRKVQFRKHPDTRGLAGKSANELIELILLMIRCVAECDAKAIPVPDEFITRLGLVRSQLMRECIDPDFSESQFLVFFGIMLKTAAEDYGATRARLGSLVEMNQLLQ